MATSASMLHHLTPGQVTSMINLFIRTILWATWLPIFAEAQISILANGLEITVPTIPGQDHGPPTFCGNSTTICPSCNGQSITDRAGSRYRVYCDTYVTWNITHRQSNVVTTTDCMLACDAFSGCMGILILPGGTCELATGTSIEMFEQTNYTVLMLEANTATSSESVPSLTESYASTSATVIPTTSQTGNGTNSCQISDISCPKCDSKIVTDAMGKGYQVHCDNQVFADIQYTFPYPLTAENCLAHCDNSTSCHGATFWPEGNCEIAQGSDASAQLMPGYTAFIPIGMGSSTVQARGTPTPMGKEIATTKVDMATTTSEAYGPYPTAKTCDPLAVKCPECKSYAIIDNAKQTYLVQCSVYPNCARRVRLPGYMPQEVCLQRCDDDPRCLAAIYDGGGCELCDDSVGDTAGYKGPNEHFVVFLLESPKGNDSWLYGHNSSAPRPNYVNRTTVSTLPSYEK